MKAFRKGLLAFACLSSVGVCACGGGSSGGEEEKPNDKQYVECGIDELCEVIEIDGEACYLKPCGSGDNRCVVCASVHPDIKMSASVTTVHEAGKASIVTFSLSMAPTSAVTITAAVSDETEIALDKLSITFTPDNWETPQTFLVSGINDGVRDGDTQSEISFTVTTTDTQYTDFGPYLLNVKCVDDGENTSSHIVLSRAGTLETTEDGQATTLSIKLDQRPTSNVTIQVVVSDPSEAVAQPKTIVFDAANYDEAQNVSIIGMDDAEDDGPQRYTVTFEVTSDDPEFSGASMPTLTFVNRDNELVDKPGKYKIRVMAANTTSGEDQAYDLGPGLRFFQAFQPDIALVQEFNYREGTTKDIEDMVITAFGPEYYYYRGTGKIPNGIVSRYPITESGGWESNVTTDRRWEWAVIDIPGDVDLLAISLHLHTDNHAVEMEPLITRINQKMLDDERQYYVVAGGDFNTADRKDVLAKMTSVFSVGPEYPVDQNDNGGTNASRTKPYDWVLFSNDLAPMEVPMIVGEHKYQHGHVLDSRVYASCRAHNGADELKYIKPVKADDSGAKNMQHMAVIRDFQIEVK